MTLKHQEKPSSIAIIVSVYKDIKSLEIILNSLQNQSYPLDEIIISEDGDSIEMKNFIESLSIPNLKHISQEDLGWQKNKALNNAIRNTQSEYIIFIDGDVVPHKEFVKGHFNCSEVHKVCCGKRSELGEKYSQAILKNEISIDKISKNYLWNIFSLHSDGVHHYEDGLYSSLLNKFTSSRKIRHIIGCNFSCYKTDLEAINGFNEDFVNPGEGEDVDITWRFKALGIQMKSCRYIANIYHLWHPKRFSDKEGQINRAIMQKSQKDNQIRALNGLKKLTEGKQ
ncbi:glycosyltransferase [Sulfurimonas microaerophilic]|uniref:glycosyltransferase n=1 Tax=Sulfurimonas microaerophilic TaxID=3058392 RepID=UPI0027148593|nr:glycosyltransferase [Sulfurimonas sp. hsl 1-7]